jgi:hypothetical protein
MSGPQHTSMEIAANQCQDVGFCNNTMTLIDSDCTEMVNAVGCLLTWSNEVASMFEVALQVLLTTLTSNRNFWVPYHQQYLVWIFFKLNEPSVEPDIKAIQVMKCTNCHPTNATSSSSSRSATRQRRVTCRIALVQRLVSLRLE